MRVLEAVYRTGSVTAAAQIINVTQPSISKTVRQVEEFTGLKLFENVAGRVLPTSHLHALMPQIRRNLLDHSRIMSRIDDLRRGRSGLIRIATSPALIDILHAEAAMALKHEEPQSDFDFRVATSTREIVELIASGEADIGTCQPSSGDVNINARPIILGQAICIMPRSHRLAKNDFVLPEDLRDEDIISYPLTEPTSRTVFERFAEFGIVLKNTIEVNWTVGACCFVNTGMGVAICSSFVDIENYFPNLCARPIAPEIPVRVDMLTSSLKPLSVLAEKFCEKIIQIGTERSGILRRPIGGLDAGS
ncbi:hypothetical protein C4K68_26975 [Pokkaliibacter plantistimulans]|uniref:HTH lysR-type domain-containing protein n=2 Tax=Pseudomonadota TaxID=1224 RepID=A0A2S5KHG2_9PROT|nr:hypothetical protein C4K68_26975 [Pokkaliibacter plantistimulans]